MGFYSSNYMNLFTVFISSLIEIFLIINGICAIIPAGPFKEQNLETGTQSFVLAGIIIVAQWLFIIQLLYRLHMKSLVNY